MFDLLLLILRRILDLRQLLAVWTFTANEQSYNKSDLDDAIPFINKRYVYVR